MSSTPTTPPPSPAPGTTRQQGADDNGIDAQELAGRLQQILSQRFERRERQRQRQRMVLGRVVWSGETTFEGILALEELASEGEIMLARR